MLENTGEGKWISAYTVEAILIQLQSFLFEKMPGADFMIWIRT